MNTNKAFIEWKKLPRSIQLDTEEWELTVWPFTEFDGKKTYHYTVRDKRLGRNNGEYIDFGIKETEDEACEVAMRAAKL